MSCYLLTCLLSTLSGIALLRLARSPLERVDQLLIAPVISLLPCILIPGLGVFLFDLPLRYTAPLAGAVVVLLAVATVPGVVSMVRPYRFVLIACLALPMMLEAPAFLAGLEDAATAKYNADLPLYVLLSHVFWKLGPFSVKPIYGPIYYLAHNVAPVWRHGASTLLVLLSYLYDAGDTQKPLALLLVFILFATTCAAVSFAAAFAPELGHAGCVLLAALLISSTWLTSIYLTSHLDELVAMAIVITLLAQARVGMETPLLFGALTSLLGYVYPEFLLILPSCFLAARGQFRGRLRGAVLGLTLVIPVLSRLKGLLGLRAMQVQISGTYKFGTFVGLTRWSTFLGAFWTAREETGRNQTLCILLVLGLTTFLLTGLWKRIRMGDHVCAAVFAPLFIGLLGAGFIIQYGYIASKFLALCSPFICLFLVTACLGWRLAIARRLATTLLIVCVCLNGMNHSPVSLHPPWPEYRALRRLYQPLQRRPIVLAVSNSFDACLAAYYLQYLPVYVAFDCGYPLECTAPDLDSATRIITGAGKRPEPGVARPILSNEIYTVWKLLPEWRAVLLDDLAIGDPPPDSSARCLFVLARADCQAHLHGRLNRTLRPRETVTLTVSSASGEKFPALAPVPQWRSAATLQLSRPDFDADVSLTHGMNLLRLELRPSGVELQPQATELRM